jgi:type II secretory pathway predicted ATPase ExeA
MPLSGNVLIFSANYCTSNRAQVGEYMKRHLSYAGAEHDIFSDSGVDEAFRYSNGAAWLVNKVSIHCLIYGTQNGRRIIEITW